MRPLLAHHAVLVLFYFAAQLWAAKALDKGPKTLLAALEQNGHHIAPLGVDHQVPTGPSKENLTMVPVGNIQDVPERRDATHGYHKRLHRHRAHVQSEQDPVERAPASTSTGYTGPYATGGTWTAAFAKAKSLVDKMTLDEKVNVVAGTADTTCEAATGSVPRLGIPSLCAFDGPTGLGSARNVSQFPAQITTAATWDMDLVSQRGAALAREFHDRGVTLMLGPVVSGPLGRSPRGGRSWESFGSDEYLAGKASFSSIAASQKNGILTCSKHFVGG